jgi:hypothetical protein
MVTSARSSWSFVADADVQDQLGAVPSIVKGLNRARVPRAA